MLIFISDLHFVDETAGKHNVPSRAFQGFFEDINKYSIKPEEIRIVFLGDIFDINRSTHWLEVEESERPWGDMENKRDKIEGHANRILNEIIKKNEATFQMFREPLEGRLPVEPERVYVPGNHDRLCNVFDSLRTKVKKNLRIPVNPEPFPPLYDDMAFGNKYGVLARHGHEYDEWNYEEDPALVPIGDLITTEIAARLPYTILQHVGNSIPPKEKENLRRNLEDIENVRPFPAAIFNWLFYQVSKNRDLKKKIEQALAEIVNNFTGLEYLGKWYKKHDKFLAFDEADKIQAALTLFRRFNIDLAEKAMRVFAGIFGSSAALSLDNSDKVLAGKAEEFLTHEPDYSYCVFGHTHNPIQVPIRTTERGIEQVYLNTGTWRKKYVQDRSNGFIGWKNLSYTIFYSREENKDQLFETWTGTLKEA